MGTTKGLFSHIVPLLCQKLMFSTEWRADMNVTLTALELLADLARLDARFIGMQHFICRFLSHKSAHYLARPSYEAPSIYCLLKPCLCAGQLAMWLLEVTLCPNEWPPSYLLFEKITPRASLFQTLRILVLNLEFH